MKTFKSIADVDRFRNHPVYASLHDTVESLVVPVITAYPDYRPEDDGYLVLIEPADVDRVLDDLDMPYRLSEVPFEDVTVVDGSSEYSADYQSGNHDQAPSPSNDSAAFQTMPRTGHRICLRYKDPRLS